MSSTPYPGQRVRLACNVQSHAGPLDSVTGSEALLWLCAPARFEIALLNGPATLLTPLDGITSLYFAILISRVGAAVVEKTFGGTINSGLIWADWGAGAQDDCHAYYELTAADMDIALPNIATDDTARLYWVVYADTSYTTPIRRPFAGGSLLVQASGANNLSVRPNTDGLRFVNGQPYLKNRETGNWNPIWTEGAGSQRHLILGEEVAL